MDRKYKILEITFNEFLTLLKGNIPNDAKIASFSFCFDLHTLDVTLESNSYRNIPNGCLVERYRLGDKEIMGDNMTKNSRPEYEETKRQLDPEDEEYLNYIEVSNGKVRTKKNK